MDDTSFDLKRKNKLGSAFDEFFENCTLHPVLQGTAVSCVAQEGEICLPQGRCV